MKNETPHPLAVEAAEQVIECYEESIAIELAQIIHTTALEPVIKAGESLHEFLEAYHGEGNPPCRKDCQVCQALTQWRTLTSPKTGDSSPLAASRNDFEG